MKKATLILPAVAVALLAPAPAVSAPEPSTPSYTVVLAGGVKSGERVVSAGVNSLKSGQAVKIDEDSQ